jgi:hypothetical protein
MPLVVAPSHLPLRPNPGQRPEGPCAVRPCLNRPYRAAPTDVAISQSSRLSLLDRAADAGCLRISGVPCPSDPSHLRRVCSTSSAIVTTLEPSARHKATSRWPGGVRSNRRPSGLEGSRSRRYVVTTRTCRPLVSCSRARGLPAAGSELTSLPCVGSLGAEWPWRHAARAIRAGRPSASRSRR